ncbi:MAG: hypothetical protein AAF937_02510 [Planctomycetota bacterium]
MRTMRKYFVACAVVLSPAGVVSAQNFVEDFEGFVSDIDFSFGTTAAPNGFSLGHTGSTDFRNSIDTLPLDFSDGNSTNGVSGFVNFEGNDEVFITPDQPVTSLSFTFTDVGSGGVETGTILAIGAGGVLDSVPMPTESLTTLNIPISFSASLADPILEIRFVGDGDDNLDGGVGFTFDNVSGTFIPAPSSAACLALAGLAMTRRR